MLIFEAWGRTNYLFHRVFHALTDSTSSELTGRWSPLVALLPASFCCALTCDELSVTWAELVCFSGGMLFFGYCTHFGTRDFRGTKVPQFSFLNIKRLFGIWFLAVCLPEITAYVPHKSSSYFLGIHLGGPGWFELCHRRVAERLWSFGPWHLVMTTLPISNMYTLDDFSGWFTCSHHPWKERKIIWKPSTLKELIFQPLIFSCCTLPES